jgi:magnesium chelatase family protein
VGRLSGPLLDRIDLHVPLRSLAFDEVSGPPGEATASVRSRVTAARERQARRSGRPGTPAVNASLAEGALRRVAHPTGEGLCLLRHAVDRLGLSARGLERALRVARTIADLGDSEGVRPRDVAEALNYRCCITDTAEAAGLREVGELP